MSDEIVNFNRSDFNTDSNVLDSVSLEHELDTEYFTLTVKNPKTGTPVFQLENFIHEENINYISGTALTRGKGLLGLAD